MTAEEVATGLVERERDDPRLTYAVLDPWTFKVDGGPRIAERINKKLIAAKMAPFRPADNTRVSSLAGKERRGPMSGWDQMRARIVGVLDKDGKPTGQPMFYAFSNCVALLRTLPVLQHDPAKPEDLDTASEDHACDEVRYACSSRPWVRTVKAPEIPKDAYREHRDDTMDVQSSVKLL